MTFRYSVVIPAYNAANTIPQAIQSIFEQTIRPQEVIVVDDGSTDGTADIVAALAGPIRIIRQQNGGPGAATTAGFRCVSAPFIATLDSDDVWLPTKTERQAAVFDSNPSAAGVFGLGRLFADGTDPNPDGPGPVQRLWTRTTLMFRVEAARAVGDFNDLPGQLGEVIDWVARSRDLGHRHVMVEEVLALRRIRRGSLSHALTADRSRGYLVAVRAAMERRRVAERRPDPKTEA
jgi:glycosyltransferase involved in cell wall biosynthesis